MMSEAHEKVRGVRELPLFPLPLVLFPGVPLPLHIFEPRYRRLLRDVRAGNNLFGVSCAEQEAGGGPPEGRPPLGHVGCAAEVVEVETLSDGRSNILTVGLLRYRVEAYVERGDPYLVGEVFFFGDDPEDARLLEGRAARVLDLFKRIARAVRVINDERAALPELPQSDPEALSFLVAAAIEIEVGVKQELLELRSTSERLERIGQLLAQAVESYEERARVHGLAKGNGHGGNSIRLE